MKKFLAIILGILLCLSLSACGGSDSSTSSDYINKSNYEGIADFDSSYNDSGEISTPEESEGSEGSLTSNRKLIKTVNLDTETRSYDSLIGWVQFKVEELGGYVENSDMYSNSDELRNANLTIRVPSNKLSEFVELIDKETNITRKSTSEEDVTLNYVDVESHRNAIVAERDKLLSLLEKAESLEDTLAIQDRLTNVQWELERLESTLRTLDSQIDYSTINLSIVEVKDYTEETPEGWWERASTGFIDTLGNIGLFFSELGIFLISNSPVIAILTAIVVVIVILIRKSNKRQKEKIKRLQESMYHQESNK